MDAMADATAFEVRSAPCPCGNDADYMHCHGPNHPEFAFFGPAADFLLRFCLAHSLLGNQRGLYQVPLIREQLADVDKLQQAEIELMGELISHGSESHAYGSYGDGPVWPQLPGRFWVVVAESFNVKEGDEKFTVNCGVYECRVKGRESDTGLVTNLVMGSSQGDKFPLNQAALLQLIRNNSIFVDRILLGPIPVIQFSNRGA